MVMFSKMFQLRKLYAVKAYKLLTIQKGTHTIMPRSMATISPKSTSPVFRIGLVGITVGALVGTGYSIRQLKKPNAFILNDESVIPTISEVPAILPSKQIVIPSDNSGLKLTLYQYTTCPFCCKVRAFLDYYGISYNIVEVDPVLRQSIKWSTYKKVPILVAELEEGYQPMNDSTMIISTLSSHLQDKTKNLTELVKYFPIIYYTDENGDKKSEIMNRYFLMLDNDKKQTRSKEDIDEERKWRKWADNVLVHSLSPNVYRTPTEALQAFNWFSEVGEWKTHFPTWERYLIIYVGAYAMWLIGKRLKKRHNLKDDVRQSLYDDCNHFARAVKLKGTPFIGGSEPNLADLAVYGVLNAIEGCDAFQDVLEKTRIRTWFFAMKALVKSNAGVNSL